MSEPQEWTGDVTFAADFVAADRRIWELTVGDPIALNGVPHTVTGGPIHHDDGSITFHLGESP